MDEQQLRRLIAEVKAGALSRRVFVSRMVALGLTAPLAVQMLTSAGVARAEAPSRAWLPSGARSATLAASHVPHRVGAKTWSCDVGASRTSRGVA